MAAFYGCLYVGAVPVPIRPPHPQNLITTLPTVRFEKSKVPEVGWGNSEPMGVFSSLVPRMQHETGNRNRKRICGFTVFLHVQL